MRALKVQVNGGFGNDGEKNRAGCGEAKTRKRKEKKRKEKRDVWAKADIYCTRPSINTLSIKAKDRPNNTHTQKTSLFNSMLLYSAQR